MNDKRVIKTAKEKEQIVLDSIKYGIVKTARKYSTNRESIRLWTKRYKKFGIEGLSKKNETHPHTMSSDDINRILKLVEKEPSIAIDKIKERLKLKNSINTIYRKLRENNVVLKNKKQNIESKNNIDDFQYIFVKVKKIKFQNITNETFLYSAYDYSSNITINSLAKGKNIYQTSVFLNYLLLRLDNILKDKPGRSIKIIFNKSPEFYSKKHFQTEIVGLISEKNDVEIKFVSNYLYKKYLKNIISYNLINKNIETTKYISIINLKNTITSYQFLLNKESVKKYNGSVLFEINDLNKSYRLKRLTNFSELKSNKHFDISNGKFDISYYIKYFLTLSNSKRIKRDRVIEKINLANNFIMKNSHFDNLASSSFLEIGDVTTIIRNQIDIATAYFEAFMFDISKEVLEVCRILLQNYKPVLKGSYYMKYDIYKLFGKIYLRTSNFEYAKEYFLELISISDILGDLRLKCESKIMIAEIYYILIDYAKAKEIYTEIAQISKDESFHLSEIRAIGTLGLIEGELGNFFEAEYHLLKAKKIAQKYNFETLKFKAYLNLALVYFNKNQYDKSLNIFSKILFESRYSKDLDLKEHIYSNIGLVFLKFKNYDRAEKYFSKSIGVSKRNKTFTTVCLCYTNIAQIYSKKYKKALEYFALAHKYIKNVINPSESFDYYIKKINYLLSYNKLVSAKTEFLNLKKNLKEIENIDFKIEIIIIGYKIEIIENLKNKKIISQNLKKIKLLLKDDLITKDIRFRKIYNKKIINNYINEISEIIKKSKIKG